LTPLNQMASVAVPDARTITIQPWDAGQLKAIEKAIVASDLGITPMNDGKLIRLVIPTLTEERRKQLAKTVGKVAEEGRVAIRNLRREANDKLKARQGQEARGRKRAATTRSKTTDRLSPRSTSCSRKRNRKSSHLV
jgi:ribosome recycling factor